MSQTYERSDRTSNSSTPRWVKGFGIVVLIVIVLAAIVLLTGGEHGPGRHLPPASATEAAEVGGDLPATGSEMQHP